ncbi:MAG: hypothetical protein ACP5KW_06740 [Thermoproteota archaeon]
MSKMKKTAIIFLVFTLLATSYLKVGVNGQINYWIGMNFDVNFLNSGLVNVSLRMHPFDIYGRSLLSNKNVTDEIIRGEQVSVNELLLLFTNNPNKIKYEVINHTYVDNNAYVLCDVNNSGTVEKLRGALIINVLIQLNSTDVVKEISNGTYVVSVKDSLTYMDPRSWIDVINFSFSDGVKLINYSWMPQTALPPESKGKNYLLWINPSEPSAPNIYMFTLTIPNFHIEVKRSKLVGEINKVDFIQDLHELKVTLSNIGNESGFFEVMINNSEVQVRKIFLQPNESVTISFPVTKRVNKVKVALLSEVGSVLSSKEYSFSGFYFDPYTFLQNNLGNLIILLGLIVILLSLKK